MNLFSDAKEKGTVVILSVKTDRALMMLAKSCFFYT